MILKVQFFQVTGIFLANKKTTKKRGSFLGSAASEYLTLRRRVSPCYILASSLSSLRRLFKNRATIINRVAEFPADTTNTIFSGASLQRVEVPAKIS